MKRLVVTVISVALGSLLFSSLAHASPEGKGNRIYLKKLKTTCKMSGFAMATHHTQDEWMRIYKAGKLNEEMERLCPGARDFKVSEEEYVTKFFFAFASDSGQVVAG